jgi:chromosome segregation ATPase
MQQLLTGPVPEGMKCDVKSLCRLSGVPRATLYRTYPHLKAEFEQRRGVEREAGRQPDARQAQIDRLQTENTRLRAHLASKDAELNELKRFRAEALSRLVAQHDEITTLRRRHPTPGGAQIHSLPTPR